MMVIVGIVAMMLFMFCGGGDWIGTKIEGVERRSALSKALQAAVNDDMQGRAPKLLTEYFPQDLRKVDLTAQDIAFLEKRFAKIQQNSSSMQEVQNVLNTAEAYRANRRAALESMHQGEM